VNCVGGGAESASQPDTLVAEVLALIGANVRRLRGEWLTQQALADRLKMSAQYLSRIERGTVNLTMDTLVRIANALKARPSELLRSIRVRPAKPGRPRKQRPRNGA
jgi:transcriptional regulator with XRE-family HTH domain